MWVTLFAHGRDATGVSSEVSWPDLVAALSDPPYAEHKMMADHRPGPCCARAWNATRSRGRRTTLIEECHALVLDWDKCNPPEILERTQGLQCFISTTFNHYSDPNRLRAVFPTAQPYPPGRHRKLFEAYRDYFGPADHVSANPSAQFFSARKHGDPLPACYLQEGAFLDPWNLPGAVRVSHGDISRLAAKYLRKALEESKAIGAALKLLGNGEPYAEPGNRDDMSWTIARILAIEYPSASPQQLAALFAPSLSLMGEPKNILDKLQRAYSSTVEDTAETLQTQFWARQNQEGRSGTYMPSEITDMGDPTKWIIQHETGLYLRTPKGFEGPVNRAHVQVLEALSVVPNIQIFGEKGYKPTQKLVEDYGQSAQLVTYSLQDQISRYRPETSEIVIATAPLRDLIPKRSEFIERWFAEAFEDPTPVLRWLSLLTDLTRPLLCLQILGERDVGKDLFAHSINRLWHTGAPAMGDKILRRFNAELKRTPLGWFNEEFPKDGLHYLYDAFKHAIGAEYLPLEMKGLEVLSIRGYIRFLATANRDLFRQAITDTPESIDALTERVLSVRMRPSPFLKANRDYLWSKFMPESELACHALSLTPERDHSRFGIAVPRVQYLRQATVTNWGSAICQVACNWLNKNFANPAFISRGGKLWVSPGLLYNSWFSLGMNLSQPKDLRSLTYFLGPLVSEERLSHKGHKYRAVNLEMLCLWADEQDVAEPHQVMTLLHACDIDVMAKTGKTAN